MLNGPAPWEMATGQMTVKLTDPMTMAPLPPSATVGTYKHYLDWDPRSRIPNTKQPQMTWSQLAQTMCHGACCVGGG